MTPKLSSPRIPQRQSLVGQTVAYLKQRIRENSWGQWLPGERGLCAELQISRNTLRAALKQLQREGVIEAIQGAGNKITRAESSLGPGLRSRDVAVLTPDSLETLRPAQALWIDGLRAMLSERDCRLHVFHGRQYFRANPAQALEKLTSQNRHGCWILTLCNKNVQRWFQNAGLPAVVGGSVYPGIDLPFRDLDHRAMCRHAAGVLLGLGHRKLGMIIQKTKRAGDIESEGGFLEGVKLSKENNVEAVFGHHDASPRGIAGAVRRLMELKRPPTALLVANPYHYLTVVSHLARMGVRVPEDVSVMSRDDDAFLSFLSPVPARYLTTSQVMAKALLRPLLELLKDGAVVHREMRILPDFVRGESLAEPMSTQT